MNHSIRIHCRLSALLEESNITPQTLAELTGLPLERIQAYCADALTEVSLQETATILDALGCAQISDLFEMEFPEHFPPVGDRDNDKYETDWHSPCLQAPDGKHIWYKDRRVSDSVYQEFVCRACGRRISVIL